MTINVAPSVTDMWTESPINIRNISSMKSKVEPSPHKVEVARIYDIMYIIHLLVFFLSSNEIFDHK